MYVLCIFLGEEEFICLEFEIVCLYVFLQFSYFVIEIVYRVDLIEEEMIKVFLEIR